MDRQQAEAGLEQLAIYVERRLGSRVEYARPWRCRALCRLVVRHWPCNALEAVEARGGRHNKAVDHAMALVLAQVHEQWEARHGVGPLWGLVLAATVRDTCEILQGLWWSDPRWRATLCDLSRHAAGGSAVEPRE